MIAKVLNQQRQFFLDGGTREVAARKHTLQALLDAISSHESELLHALHADLRKNTSEAYLSEIGWLEGEIRHALRHIKSWSQPTPARTPIVAWPGKVTISREPLGNVLILGPWNYPVQLALGPLIAAIAAGNTAVVKTSEHAPHSSAAVKHLIESALPAEWVFPMEGGLEISTELLQQHWDLVFFTGGTEIGRKVMQAAAKHLTPVILELGGKCPCIVMKDSNLDVAARRIIWGKTLNAGQTCVAPDYVWVEEEVVDLFLQRMKHVLVEFFGENPQTSADYGRLIHQRQFERLTEMLDGCNIVHGGRFDAKDLYLEPTLVRISNWNSPLMQEEVFGPILPVIAFSKLDRLLYELRSRPSPLAVYLFSQSPGTIAKVEQETRSGALCVNDTIVQLLGRDLPFGGIGESGIGRYHGKAGFDAFSYERVSMKRGFRFDAPFRYPPVNTSLKWLRKLSKWSG